MKYVIINKFGAVVVLFILVSLAMLPSFSALTNSTVVKTDNYSIKNNLQEDLDTDNAVKGIYQRYDTIYIPEEDVSMAGIQNDIGYNVDAGSKPVKSLPICKSPCFILFLSYIIEVENNTGIFLLALFLRFISIVTDE